MSSSADITRTVTNKIVNLIESGTPPWVHLQAKRQLARNIVTGRAYTGINSLTLNFCYDYERPYFITRKQIEKLGGVTPHWVKSVPVYFYLPIRKDIQGNIIQRRDILKTKVSTSYLIFREMEVYHVDDVEGIDFTFPALPEETMDVTQVGENLLASFHDVPKIKRNRKGNAYYRIDKDYISIPPIEDFPRESQYYNVLFHELIHGTGAAHRLNRKGVSPNRGKRTARIYAQEELVAEIGAAFLARQAGFDSPEAYEDSASYLSSYLDLLNKDSRAIFFAATAAQKAVDYLNGKPVKKYK